MAGSPPSDEDSNVGTAQKPQQPPLQGQLQRGLFQVGGQACFTCFLYIHGATSFLGLPVPPGGRRLPLRELLFFRPLTLVLAPLVQQGLLPRHNQNPHVKGPAVRRGPPEPEDSVLLELVSTLGLGIHSLLCEWVRTTRPGVQKKCVLMPR